MASHVVGPFLIGGRQLESAERTLLDETSVWTFSLLEPPPTTTTTTTPVPTTTTAAPTTTTEPALIADVHFRLTAQRAVTFRPSAERVLTFRTKGDY